MSAHPQNNDAVADEDVNEEDPPSQDGSIGGDAHILPGEPASTTAKKLASLHQRNIALLKDNRQRKTRYDVALLRMHRSVESKDVRFNVMKSSLTQRAEIAEARVRANRTEFTAKHKAGELEFRVRLKATGDQAKS